MSGHSPLLSEVNDFEAVAIVTPEPLDALQLRVDEQWPALTVTQYCGVLSGHLITRQTFIVPLGDRGVIC